MDLIICRNIKEVYMDVTSDQYLKHVFKKCSVHERDIANHKIVFNAYYNKGILDAYKNDLLNMLRTLCLVDKISINVEQKIFPFNDRFIMCYLMKVQNHQEIPFIPFLDTLRSVFVLEFKDIGQDRTCCRIIDVLIDHNLVIDISKIKVSESKCEDDAEYKEFSYDDMQEVYKKQQKEFFKGSDYDIQKDIVVNFLNMLLNDCIRYAYLKKMCKYYANKHVDMYKGV